MGKRLLVLNVNISGMNGFLFSQLRKNGWELLIVDVPAPRYCRWWAMLTTFSPDRGKWRQEFYSKLGKMHKSSRVFRQRSRFCEGKINKLQGRFDEVLQISGTFAPFAFPAGASRTGNSSYKLLVSYTMKLSRGFPDWEPPADEFDKVVELETQLYRRAEKILTTNDNVGRSLINDYGVAKERILKIGYGCTIEQTAGEGKFHDRGIILFIGLEFERKGGYVLLEAFRQVRRELPDARLFIVGPDRNALKIEEPGVEVFGRIQDQAKLKELYRQASVFAMPSLMEPFGLVFLEAMAFGLPCIGSDVDAMPEIIENGKTGYLVPPGQPEMLAARLIDLLRDRQKMQEMGRAGRQRCREEFSWERVGERMMAGWR
jgi:glycosyltransferase involved in cell wall biosynthesis